MGKASKDKYHFQVLQSTAEQKYIDIILAAKQIHPCRFFVWSLSFVAIYCWAKGLARDPKVLSHISKITFTFPPSRFACSAKCVAKYSFTLLQSKVSFTFSFMNLIALHNAQHCSQAESLSLSLSNGFACSAALILAAKKESLLHLLIFLQCSIVHIPVKQIHFHFLFHMKLRAACLASLTHNKLHKIW